MVKVMTTQEVLNILETGDFEKLIGAMESEVLEFKGAPYQLDTPKLKLELAKDVSALANVAGGIILIGVGTSIPEEHPHEMIDRIRPFEENLINIIQHEDVIDNWIYPNPNVTIKWIPFIKKSEKGIVSILIPESKIGKKPFLIMKLLDEDDKVMKNVVGFFQRKGDRVSNLSAEEKRFTT